jgi:hypothetical protein
MAKISCHGLFKGNSHENVEVKAGKKLIPGVLFI